MQFKRIKSPVTKHAIIKLQSNAGRDLMSGWFLRGSFVVEYVHLIKHQLYIELDTNRTSNYTPIVHRIIYQVVAKGITHSGALV